MKGIITLILLLLPAIAAAALDNEKQLYEIASTAMAEVDKKNLSGKHGVRSCIHAAFNQ